MIISSTLLILDESDGHFVNTAINETIHLLDPESEFNAASSLGYVIVAVAAAAVYISRKNKDQVSQTQEEEEKEASIIVHSSCQNHYLFIYFEFNNANENIIIVIFTPTSTQACMFFWNEDHFLPATVYTFELIKSDCICSFVIIIIIIFDKGQAKARSIKAS